MSVILPPPPDLFAAGVVGGQTLVGGRDAGDDLILRATANATPGDIIFESEPGVVVGRFASTGVFSVGTLMTVTPSTNVVNMTASSAGGTVNLQVQNSNTAADSNARLLLASADLVNGADVFVHFATSGTAFSMGTDGSADTFKLTTGATPSAGTELFTITTSGVLTLGTALAVTQGGTGVTAASTGTGGVVLSSSPTIVTPTIASFTNATHTHADAAGGGTLNASAIAAGTLAIAQGGTNAATKTAAFDNLSPVTTKGDIIVRNGSNNIRLPVGADTFVLTADAAEASGIKWAAVAAGGNTWDGVYDQGGAAAGRTANIDAGSPFLASGGGTPPANSTSVLLHLHDSTSSTADAELTITSGTSGESIINLGDSADEDIAFISHDNSADRMVFATNTVERFRLNDAPFGAHFNQPAVDYDYRISGDTLAYLLFCEGNPASENIAFLTTAAPNWQSMDRGYFIGDVTTAPTGNPTAGLFVWSAAGEGTARTGVGTVTVWAPDGPHCEVCGSDFWAVASMNMNWKSWCFICGVCDAAYKGGPQNVLDQLAPRHKTALIRQTSTWDDMKNLMKLVA